MIKSLEIIKDILDNSSIELNRLISTYSTKSLLWYSGGEIEVDKDFMKIFSTIAYAKSKSASDYLINGECINWVRVKPEDIPYNVQTHKLAIEVGDDNLLRRTGCLIFNIANYCMYEERSASDVLSELYEKPAEKVYTIKSKVKHKLKLQEKDFDLETKNFNVNVLSLISNKRIDDIVTEMIEMY